jgi:hypothetical protein
MTVPGSTRAPSRRRTPALLVGSGVVAVVLGWVLAAPMEYSFGGADQELPYVPDAWAPAYAWVFETVGEPLGLTAYYFWGKLAFLLYVVGLLLARALPVGRSRAARVGRLMLLGALLVGLVGDVLGYWGGWGHADMTTLTSIGFIAFELPAMLVMVIGLVVTGIGLRQESRAVSWVLLVGVVVTVPFSTLVIGYLPHGVLVPVLATLTGAALVERRAD